MTTIASRGEETRAAWLPGRRIGLSGRLILLTMLFVMLAEVMIYLPSVASFRRSLITDRIMGAQMVALALSATSPEALSPELETKLLAGIKGAQAIGVRGPGTRWLLERAGEAPPPASLTIDMREAPWWGPLRGVARTLLTNKPNVIRIIGPGVPGVTGVEWVEIITDEAPLRHAVIGFTRNFLLISLAISAITGALLYLALHLIVVRPVRRLAGNIEDFARDPEDASRIIRPSLRQDEIGRAEEALARMETALAGELRQKRHLADLGLAVSKINHELRNMLTTAQLLGDRLGELEDPTVRRIAPRLVRTLARAIDFCGATLAYGRAGERPPQRKRIRVRPLVEEQLDLSALTDSSKVAVTVSMPDDLVIDADPDQLARVLLNLLRNAVEALSRADTRNAALAIAGERRNGVVILRVSDNGPGIPERIRDRLFSAFQASDQAGGTGLGLPVADELVRLHRGTIVLDSGSQGGASFLITIPDRPAEA
ncbi:sensor histidine kinase [uncultured Enterovirga sp.]|uniref:sensor histidine kinase n=1 Tax=uncultured Enterovirga sp. TaxID=2026352 RepID=UPI0035CC0071